MSQHNFPVLFGDNYLQFIANQILLEVVKFLVFVHFEVARGCYVSNINEQAGETYYV